MKKFILLIVALAISLVTFAQGTITYNLNGGVTNDYGWKNKGDMFAAFMTDNGATEFETLDYYKAQTDPLGAPNICAKLTTCAAMLNDTAKWGWLKIYIQSVHAAQADDGASTLDDACASAAWRYAAGAFFVDGRRATWPKSADFSVAGLIEAFQPSWKHGFCGPESYAEGETVVLPTPYMEGETFLGWYKEADFSGEKVTEISGTGDVVLYAKFGEYIPTLKEGEQAVFFENTSNWSGDINAYLWADNGAIQWVGAWPGEACTYLGDNIWKWTYTGSGTIYGGLIFNSPSTGKQTADLEFVNGGYYDANGYVKTITPTGEIVDSDSVAQADVFVAGSFNNWSPNDSEHRMTLQLDRYTKTYENLPAGSYEFKVVYNGAWKGADIVDPNESTKGYVSVPGGNISFTLPQPATVTISYFDWMDLIYLVAEGIDQFGQFTIEYYSICGSSAIFGEEFLTDEYRAKIDDYKMSDNFGDGTYTKTFTSIHLDADVEYRYKVAANGTWNEGQFPQVGDMLFSVSQSGLYNLTFKYIPGADSLWVEPVLIESLNEIDSLYISYVVCHGDTFYYDGMAFYETGIYQLESANRDTITTINLTVLPDYRQTFDATIKEGEVYSGHGFEGLTQPGTYSLPLLSLSTGCDSTVILNLSVVENEMSGYRITYQFNGGVTNDYGWKDKQDMYAALNADYNAYTGSTNIWTPLAELTDFTKGIPLSVPTWDMTFFTSEEYAAKWAWLVTYMDNQCAEQGVSLASTSSAYMRYNLAAFFSNTMRTNWPISADFSLAGDVSYFQKTWKAGFDNPKTYTEGDSIVLNVPYKEGYTFIGWYKEADLSGENVTVITGIDKDITLYAGWTEYIPTIKEVIAMEDSTATKVQGTVTYTAGSNFWIQDETAGILCYGRNNGVTEGDYVVISGEKVIYKNSPELNSAVVVSIEAGEEIVPQKLLLANIISDSVNNYKTYLNELVYLESVVLSRYEDKGTYKTPYVTDGDTEIALYRWDGVTEDKFPVGSKVSVKAVLAIYNETLQLRGRVEWIEVTEIGYPTIAEVIAMADETEVTVQGTVSYVAGSNFWIQDATGGILCYGNNNGLVEGELVTLSGVKTIYRGSPEINNATVVVKEVGTEVVAEPLSLSEVLADTVNGYATYLNEMLYFEGVEISRYEDNGSYITPYITDGGTEIALYKWDGVTEDKFPVGSKVSVKAVLSIYNETLQLRGRVEWIEVTEKGYYTLNVNTNYPGYASVEIQDNVGYNDNEATIFAYTNYIDLRFVRWSDGSTENPRTITLTSDTTLIAEFELCYAIMTYSVDEAKGVIDETIGTITGGGQFSEGDSTTITAIPSEGYMFDYFLVYKYSEGTITTVSFNPMIFTYINQNYHIEAHFKKIPVLIDGLYYDLTDAPEGITVRFYNSAWSQVNIWAWNENGNLFEEWPGVPMNNEGNGWWSYTFDPSIENINVVFNDGGNGYQTADVEGITENMCYGYAGDFEVPYVEDCGLLNEPKATVTYAYEGEYSGAIVVPDEVVYNNKTYKVTSIEERVFAGHPITSLSITNNITYVPELNLYGCYDLTQLKAHADLIDNISNLSTINIEELYVTGGYIDWLNKADYPSLKVLDLSATENYDLPYGFFKGEEYDYNYEGFAGLRKLVLPNNLNTIYNRQFRELWSLEEIVIPDGVTEIPEAAFYDCHALSNVTLSENLTSIGNYAFYSCHALENIVIPEGVTEIGNAAFYGCTYLEEIEMPSTLEEVGNNAFALCSKVKSIKVKAHTPPTLWAKTFYEVDRNTPVYVAEVAYNDYVADQYWGEFFNIISVPESGTPTGVENEDAVSVVIYTQGGMLYIEGAETDYRVFDASGRLIYTGRDTQLSLPNGIYLLNVDNKTYKIVM